VQIRRAWLHDFRNYVSAEIPLSPGLTAIVGRNGEGKTNLVEAIAWLATLSSFRGASTEAMIRDGQPSAVIRAEVQREGRELLIEAELAASGRNRVQVNRQRLQRGRDLLGALRVTVFGPDDLVIVKAGPTERRRFMDEALVACDARYDALRREVERVLRQRNALLRSAGGSLDESATVTLDVWNTKLSEAGESLARARMDLLERLRPLVAESYAALSDVDSPPAIGLAYSSEWIIHGLAAALEAARAEDVRRGVSTVGPHRDDLTLTLGGLPARSHASQGEQRTLALALRLALHRLVADAAGSTPVLLLDDVFSELDPGRGTALLKNLPHGQVVVTTAGRLPEQAQPDCVLEVSGGAVRVR
jgi:DNA replication and repair protein RecF